MLVGFDFAVTQTAYVKAAMDEIPSFRPDGETPAQVQARVESATPVRAEYVAKKSAIDAARAERRTTIETLHGACVEFLAQGRSLFRKNATVKERFDRLPVDDKTFQQTMTRAAANAALWTTLPPVGTPPVAFSVRDQTATLFLAGFEALVATAGAADAAIPGVDQDFQAAEGVLHEKQAELEDFVTAALEQGRSQYAVGTAEREIIDAVPTNSDGSGGGSTPLPPALPLPTALENFALATGEAGSGSVVASADAPAPAEQVTVYHIISSEGQVVASPTTLPAVVGGFTPGTEITLTARAVNATGEGPASAAASATAG